MSCATPLHLILLRQALPLNLELGWWPPSPSDPPASTSHSAGVTLGVGDFTQKLMLIPQAPSPPIFQSYAAVHMGFIEPAFMIAGSVSCRIK